MTRAFLTCACALALLPFGSALGQTDTTGIYGERKDSLNSVVFTAQGPGNFLSRSKAVRTEVISAAGLCKMACCNLAESFENTASVTVGYSDAVTGARQIRLLGQSGIYTQLLDENRPVLRGIAAPFGLSFIPGQWLESIQIAKGVSSVLNGAEAMTGQINMEHRKPTDEQPLFIQASVMHDTKADINAASSLQLDKTGRWSTVLLGHADANFMEMDRNGDGFMDDPRQRQLSLSNRWQYFGPDGTQVRFGVRAIWDYRKGGQLSGLVRPWQTDIHNRHYGGYVKAGIPLNEDNSTNFAAIADYSYHDLQAGFGTDRRYDAGQHTAFLNLLYQNQSHENHHFTLGISEMLDHYREAFGRTETSTLSDLGVFGEYTFHGGERFSAIVGLRGDWYNLSGFHATPRLTLKWAPAPWLVLRANGGRGLRYSIPLADNFGVLSSSRQLAGDYLSHPLEDAWTYGANATWHIGGADSGTYLSFDFFRTRFFEQMLVDYPAGEPEQIRFYTLSSLGEKGRSATTNYQLDFGIEPLPRFTVTLTGRLTDARQTLSGQSDDIKPMTSLYKGVLNLQYATRLNKWIFDFTAAINGPCRVWDVMRGYKGMYENGYTDIYPLLYAQITKRFRGVDIYIGGENLTDFRQPDPILHPDDTHRFDASLVWGPLAGIRLYAGLRITLWKI